MAGAQTVSFAEPCGYFREGKAKASTLSLSVLVAIEMFNALNALSEVRMPNRPLLRSLWIDADDATCDAPVPVAYACGRQGRHGLSVCRRFLGLHCQSACIIGSMKGALQGMRLFAVA